ncbi:MAG TPA: alpha/beta hydrolase [Polyangia bacterium]|jgi:alpha-beta hydrolase superfamily lysophospholipase
MSFFQSRDGTQLHEETWPAAGKALASVVIVHGYGEHIARYDEAARAIAAAGFSVRGLDLRGHGQSGGVRGFCNRFDEYLDDVEAIVGRARAEGLPVFLLGHSFGALVAPHYALRHPTSIAGLVLTSPYWKLALAQPALKIWAGKLASIIAPKLALPAGLKGADVCRDPAIQAKYDADPLNNKNATARWFTESTTAQEQLLVRAPELTLPTLLLVGEADRIAAAPQARVVFERIGAEDKTLRMLAGQYHEVLNEPKPTRDQTVAEIVEWLRAHAAKASASSGEKLRASEA